MSAETAFVIAVLTLGSCFASYHIGRESVLSKMRNLRERRRRWQEFDDE